MKSIQLDQLMEKVKDIYSSAPDVEFDESSSIFIISTIIKIAATYKPCTKYWTKKVKSRFWIMIYFLKILQIIILKIFLHWKNAKI